MALKFENIKRVFTMRIPPERFEVEDEKKQRLLSHNQVESSFFIFLVSHENMVSFKLFAMLLETRNLQFDNSSKDFPSGISGCTP
jgi:arginyl-tRNA--protein-N-Asp/Glu arginylyltransferase